MTIEDAGRIALAAEALACIWMARLAWKVAASEPLYFRIVGPTLCVAAAALILYGSSYP
jgi:hypothetical protein